MKEAFKKINETIDDAGEVIKDNTGDSEIKNTVVDVVKDSVKPVNLVVGVATGALLGGLF